MNFHSQVCFSCQKLCVIALESIKALLQVLGSSLIAALQPPLSFRKWIVQYESSLASLFIIFKALNLVIP